MSFVSQVPDCPIVTDLTNIEAGIRRYERVHGKGSATTYEPRDLAANPLGSHECASTGRITLIPEVEWKERIIEREAKQQRNLDLLNTYKIPPLHQGSTWACWANAPTDNFHFTMAYNGGPVIVLSPGSVAGPVKRYRKAGGNCSEANDYMAEHGIASQRVWSANNYYDSNLDNDQSRADRARHRVLEWDDLEPRNWAEFISTLLTPGRTVAYCNYAMRHAVLAIDPIINARGEIGVLTRNSGLYRDSKGFTQFFGKYAMPDDATSIRSVTIDARATE